MKKFLPLLIMVIMAGKASAQKIDSIYFNLYTDSLKKGVHNYINVDGKTNKGKWLPLTSSEITLNSNYGTFEGNDLILPADFKEKNVTVKAILKSNPAVWKEVTIWIKTVPDPAVLPTKDEILRPSSSKNKRN